MTPTKKIVRSYDIALHHLLCPPPHPFFKAPAHSRRVFFCPFVAPLSPFTSPVVAV